MHASDADYFFLIASNIGQFLLLILIFIRRLNHTFPAFTAFMLWQVISDVFVFLALYPLHGYIGNSYGGLYYTFGILSYILELFALLEIAGNVLHPVKRLVALNIHRLLYGVIMLIGVVSFCLTIWISGRFLPQLHTFLMMDTVAAALCVILFLLIAGFSQVLGLNWRNHVTQLATGFAFYSILDLLVQLVHSQLHKGPSYSEHYQVWSWIGASGYICSVYFWCWAFAKKEAPRRDFSPQMAKFLASLSRSAKRQNAVLARSRDE